MMQHEKLAEMLRECGMNALADKIAARTFGIPDLAALSAGEAAALGGIMIAIGYDDTVLFAVASIIDKKMQQSARMVPN